MKTKSIIIHFLIITSISFSQNETKVVPVFEELAKYQNIRDFTISTTQDEVYFSIQNTSEDRAVIAVMKKKNNIWQKPEITSFTGKFRNIEPFLSSDGLRLYFASNRPLENDAITPKDYDIWYVQRKNIKSNWSEPINIGAPVNSTNDEFYPCVTLSGNLYFTSDAVKSQGKDDILISNWDGKQYLEPKNLGSKINSAGYEFNAFVSPDETFIIYTCYGKEVGFGSGDLYISYKDINGNWDYPKNLGSNLNSKQMDYCPFYDTSTQILYFTSKRIEPFLKEIKSLAEFEAEITKYENGFSRIYKTQIKL